MLPILRYKILLFIIAVTNLTVCSFVVAFGALEVYADLRKLGLTEDSPPINVPKIIGFSIFAFCNILIFVHISYLSLHALRGYRYTWYVSCNYFLYVLWELISVIVLMTRYKHLNYPLGLIISVATQCVLLFLITCLAELIFAQLEVDINTLEKYKMHRRISGRLWRHSHRRTVQCVRINLKGTSAGAVNVGAGTSGSTGSKKPVRKK